MRTFFDSSALAKRYIEEPGSDKVQELCSNANEILLSIIAPVEILSGMSRLHRDGRLSTSLYKRLKHEFGTDLREASVVNIDEKVIKLAIHALEVAPLRTLDAIQVASGNLCRCDLFVSADKQQVLGAKLLGLETILVTRGG